MLLGEAVDINVGVLLKRQEAKYDEKEKTHYKVFNIKSYEEKTKYEDFYSIRNLDNYTVKRGDLILRLSMPNKIILIDEKTEGLLINNLYCIIRNDKKIIDTDFLRWFLESSNAKKQLEKIIVGTNVKVIPVAKLRFLEIPDINIKEQEKISLIINKWNKQKELYNKIISEKESYYESIIDELINRGNK